MALKTAAALGADGEAEGGILDVAAGDDFAGGCEEGGTDFVIGIGGVGVVSGFGGAVGEVGFGDQEWGVTRMG